MCFHISQKFSLCKYFVKINTIKTNKNVYLTSFPIIPVQRSSIRCKFRLIKTQQKTRLLNCIVNTQSGGILFFKNIQDKYCDIHYIMLCNLRNHKNALVKITSAWSAKLIISIRIFTESIQCFSANNLVEIFAPVVGLHCFLRWHYFAVVNVMGTCDMGWLNIKPSD